MVELELKVEVEVEVKVDVQCTKYLYVRSSYVPIKWLRSICVNSAVISLAQDFMMIYDIPMRYRPNNLNEFEWFEWFEWLNSPQYS